MKARIRATAFIGGLFFSLSLAGCQTARHKEFQKVKAGMEKGDVLEATGNPTRTQRWQGKDRWIYVFQSPESNTDIKEVHFSDGRVVYAGNPIPPEVSAEDQDKKNYESNLAVEKAWRAEIEAAKGASQRYQEGSSREEEARKTVPTYERVD